MRIAHPTTRVRWLAAAVTVLFVIIGGAFVPTTANALPFDRGFLQVRDNGQLWFYEWNGSSFDGRLADDGGWGQTKLVALLDSSTFVELKGDALRAWRLTRSGGRYRVTFLETVDTGWSNTRLIAGVGNIRGDGGAEFIQVRHNGDLMLYTSRGNGYVFEQKLDNGYENARLIAGRGYSGGFVVINDHGDLWTYDIPRAGSSDPRPTGVRRMSGWENVRLLSPGGNDPLEIGDSLASVRYNGQLVQWFWDQDARDYDDGYTDTNWFNARLIG